ncbi:hypothetical protein [Pajaroellobacter abortibovis]|uniref:Uncharacterized protein n=1 Tax=Pajaroellobacter abortibovis TaxID=1882918 RepID=A0A1L6MVI6_9BACT|nr:hypothetical protein [Pajaroellobacter abortibovis]APR99536.1 hypothetical protein BCY86_01705 [Pajaroellobacter abortibovis]
MKGNLQPVVFIMSVFSLVFIMLSTAGCDSDTGIPNKDAGSEASPDIGKESGWPIEISKNNISIEEPKALCETINRCCGYDEGTFLQDTCTDLFKKSGGLREEFYQKEPYFNSPNVSFNQDKATQCIEIASKFSCSRVSPIKLYDLLKACVGAFTGNLKEGDPGCKDTIECESGYCDHSTGICTALKKEGEPCTEQDQCRFRGLLEPQDLYCNLPAGASSGICTKVIATGSQCSSNILTDHPSLYYMQCSSMVCEAPSGQGTHQCQENFIIAASELCDSFDSTKQSNP